ncbi:MAG TPA: serine hydrolase domain-containing protein, partial [Roseimicrobium sp.]|nr:serine hydrolase domain-containing protein [Roseimicrobium sp.]
MKASNTASKTVAISNVAQTCVVLAGLLLAAAPLFAKEIPVVAPDKAGLAAEKLVAVDEFMAKAVADQKIAGGIIMVARDGKVGFFKTYGQRDLEAKKPMEPDTIFRIYSMSKSITTAAALKLVEQGKIGLDDKVSKYIPSFANIRVATPDGLRLPTRAMTIRDLMRHTAGLTYGDGPDALKTAYKALKPMESKDLAEMAEKLSQVPLAYDPGTSWFYSVSIDVLGRVIEVASGESLDVHLEKVIFKPLDMPDTAFNVPAEKLPRFAANYK